MLIGRDITNDYLRRHPPRAGVADDYMKELGMSNEPEHVRRSIEVSATYYESKGWNKADTAKHLAGIDHNAKQAPRIMEFEPGTVFHQRVDPKAGQGNYYNPGTDGSYARSGVSMQGRRLEHFEAVDRVDGLQTRAADAADRWTDSRMGHLSRKSGASGSPVRERAEFTRGGADQIFIPDRDSLAKQHKIESSDRDKILNRDRAVEGPDGPRQRMR